MRCRFSSPLNSIGFSGVKDQTASTASPPDTLPTTSHLLPRIDTRPTASKASFASEGILISLALSVVHTDPSTPDFTEALRLTFATTEKTQPSTSTPKEASNVTLTKVSASLRVK